MQPYRQSQACKSKMLRQRSAGSKPVATNFDRFVGSHGGRSRGRSPSVLLTFHLPRSREHSRNMLASLN
eukprot:838968-Pyramimonas_sp.AAC.1